MVELLECGKKNTHCAWTFDGKPDQLIGVFWLRFAVQVFYQVITNRLANSLGRTLPTILSMQTPLIRGKVGKVRKQGIKIRACCCISNVLLKFVVKGCQWSMRKAIGIHDDD